MQDSLRVKRVRVRCATTYASISATWGLCITTYALTSERGFDASRPRGNLEGGQLDIGTATTLELEFQQQHPARGPAAAGCPRWESGSSSAEAQLAGANPTSH